MNIAIAGYGIEGEENYRYFLAQGHTVTIVDESTSPSKQIPAGAKTDLGPGAFDRLQGFDMVVRTAGLAPRKLLTDAKVWSATNEFMKHCPSPVIGVTGTKGKGTTSSLIASILSAAGRTVHLVGNIGVPALQTLPHILPSDIVVYEMSSFQLWDLELSPYVSVVLPVEADHLDVHADMDEYVKAKANIATHQRESDVVIYHADNKISQTISEQSRGDRIPYPSQQFVHVNDGWFYDGEKKICKITALQLPGVHNQENACAAISAAGIFIETGFSEAVQAGLERFTGLPHRLKLVREVNGVRYFDDSIATTPGSAIAAVKSFSDPIVLLLGGKDKGGDYSELLELCGKKDVTVIIYGENRQHLANMCEKYEVKYKPAEGTMKSVVSLESEVAREGSVVILSPAASSFDMFKNYAARGDAFVHEVTNLGGGTYVS